MHPAAVRLKLKRCFAPDRIMVPPGDRRPIFPAYKGILIHRLCKQAGRSEIDRDVDRCDVRRGLKNAEAAQA